MATAHRPGTPVLNQYGPPVDTSGHVLRDIWAKTCGAIGIPQQGKRTYGVIGRKLVAPAGEDANFYDGQAWGLPTGKENYSQTGRFFAGTVGVINHFSVAWEDLRNNTQGEVTLTYGLAFDNSEPDVRKWAVRGEVRIGGNSGSPGFSAFDDDLVKMYLDLHPSNKDSYMRLPQSVQDRMGFRLWSPVRMLPPAYEWVGVETNLTKPRESRTHEKLVVHAHIAGMTLPRMKSALERLGASGWQGYTLADCRVALVQRYEATPAAVVAEVMPKYQDVAALVENCMAADVLRVGASHWEQKLQSIVPGAGAATDQSVWVRIDGTSSFPDDVSTGSVAYKAGWFANLIVGDGDGNRYDLLDSLRASLAQQDRAAERHGNQSPQSPLSSEASDAILAAVNHGAIVLLAAQHRWKWYDGTTICKFEPGTEYAALRSHFTQRGSAESMQEISIRTEAHRDALATKERVEAATRAEELRRQGEDSKRHDEEVGKAVKEALACNAVTFDAKLKWWYADGQKVCACPNQFFNNGRDNYLTDRCKKDATAFGLVKTALEKAKAAG